MNLDRQFTLKCFPSTSRREQCHCALGSVLSALKKEVKRDLNQDLLDGTKIQIHRNMKKECRDGNLHTDGTISLHYCFPLWHQIQGCSKNHIHTRDGGTHLQSQRRENLMGKNVSSSLACSVLACLHTHQINIKYGQREWLPCFGVDWTSLD